MTTENTPSPVTKVSIENLGYTKSHIDSLLSSAGSNDVAFPGGVATLLVANPLVTTARKVLQASEDSGRLVFPEGVTASAIPVNKGIAFIFPDGSELTVGKVTIDFYGVAGPQTDNTQN